MSVAPYSFATLTQFGLVPTAKILPAPRFLAPATEHKPTGPIPITATVDSTDPDHEVFSGVADNNEDNEAYYIARVTLTQKVRDNWKNDNLVEKSNSMVVKIPLPAGKTKFEINNSYNVNLTLYGFERIIVNTTLEAWKYGGEIDVIGE